MEHSNMILSQEGQLAYLTINRESVRNALDQPTLEEMVEKLEDIKKNDSVKCVIFTGAGEKSFAAGADIGKLAEKNALDALNPENMQKVYDYIEAFPKPTIAMINGYALGGGCELAMSCDIRIAAEHAKLGLPELNLSIIPGAGGTQRLSRLVGKGKAMEWIMTGKMIKAEEAERFGLVSQVVPAEVLKQTVEELAETILSKGPLALKMAKLSIHAGYETDQKTGLLIEQLAQAVLFGSEDKNEGTNAFLEKRKPDFAGK
ncbi:enoyl-CoA hydratase/isomerase family protein [Sinobaca sp. H24]|uniref:enoyl-CoA hydratase/isomerase family protein n=1 Tax=Sinobaca sp. H24 TaxID=2923376 RepID=UPI0020793F41|nr:enoyl-CoA hydratase-related protein [Sinobaca sp. H24]